MCYFVVLNSSVQLYSVSRNGQLCIWESDTDLAGLIPYEDKDKHVSSDEEGEEEAEGNCHVRSGEDL